VPERIGRYEIEKELGRGGMAIVYLARDPLMDRPVAVKVLPRQFTFDPKFRERFRREARLVARLQHPAIVPVYDFGEEDDQLFLVMAYMSGGSLHDRLRGGPLALEECARIMNELAPALDAAHQRGMIHRDLKPANILFDEWAKPYLADFGITKLIAGSDTALTVTGGLVGTPAYMSPEQALALKELDGRSDLYALGFIFFQMVTGRTPYTADTPMGIALKHISEPVPRVADDNPTLPPAAQAVIDRAMAKEPATRYDSAAALAGAIRAMVERPVETAPPSPAPEPIAAPAATSAVLEEVPQPPAAAQQEGAAAAAAVDGPPPAAVDPSAAVPAADPEPGADVEETAIDHPPTPTPVDKGPAWAPAWPVRTADPTALDRPPPRATAEPSAERNWLVPATGAVLVALLLFFGLRGLLAGGRDDPETLAADLSVLLPDASLGDTWTRPQDGMVMVYVPAGSFLMGSAAGDPDAYSDEFPQHEVSLNAFWLDQTEVTNEQYESCMADGECRDSAYANDARWNGSIRPVVGVSWNDAADYCAWAGGRLPTEAQWEYAARGPESLKYPWGNSAPSDTLLNYNNNIGRTTDVGSYPDGESWIGALDMAGNVWEWVADWYDSDYYIDSPEENPAGPSSGQYKVLRGGSWYLNARYVRGANRYSLTATSRSTFIGFRCSLPQA
jgi:eukaryotic-like serine/threonine-protein kinase